MVRKKKTLEKTSYMGHRTNRAFYIIIVLLIILVVAQFLLAASSIRELRSQLRKVKTELAYVDSERARYQDAYEIVLADVQAFGRMHQVDYEGEADTPSQGESGGVHAEAANVKHLGELDVWGFYRDQGIIDDSCIETTKLVQTDDDIVEIVVVATGESAEEAPRLRLLIDAQQLETFMVEGDDGLYKMTMVLPKGTHYLALLHDNAERSGSVSISLVRIGDRTLENDISVIDEGIGFEAFDCKDTKTGNTMKRNGAMRFRVEKV